RRFAAGRRPRQPSPGTAGRRALMSRTRERCPFAPSLEPLEDRTVPASLHGLTTPGVFDPGSGTSYLLEALRERATDAGQFAYGGPGWRAVTGDWRGTGSLGIGVVNPATNTWYLRSTASAGTPDVATFQYGAPGMIPLVGDWDGDGTDGIGG